MRLLWLNVVTEENYIKPTDTGETVVANPREDLGSIVAIEVDKLFGRYSYRLNSPDSGGEEQQRLMLLYGDNGVGKLRYLS